MPPNPLLTALRLPLQAVPDPLQSLLLTRVLNRLLRRQPLAARLNELEGCSIGIHIRDADTRLHFRIRNGELVAAGEEAARVTIRGDLRDFVALATRAEDPDTLFFQRRLCIEGDVETGLHVKNLLDTIDYDWEARVRERLPRGAGDLAVRFVRHVRTLVSAGR